VLSTRENLPVDPNQTRTIDEGTYYEHKRSVVDLMIQLRESPFGHMNLDALVEMARHMVDVRFPAGTVLWNVGESSDFSLHIDAGRVSCTAPDGRRVEVGRGYTIGVLDVWGKHERVYEARAETDIIAFRIEFEAFLALLEMHPEVGLDLLRGFAADLLNEREFKKSDEDRPAPRAPSPDHHESAHR
jgi:CRP-like cAMP-binding protein